MPAKEIKELRQAGRLPEALAMAQEELNANPENIWGKRNISWVYYEYLKKYSQPDSFDVFKENLINLKDLQLPEGEKMVFDNCAWQIGSLLFGLLKTDHADSSKIDELFEIIKDFHFTKPSEAYSFLFKAFHKGYKIWSNYVDFANWWGLENFRPEDYLTEEFNDNKRMSIAEQAYIGYSKKILEGEPQDAFGALRQIDKDKIRAFLPKLDVIIESHPEYQYPPYFKAKLLVALGDDEDVLSAFLPFAKQKRNNFWVWELMADIFPDDEAIQFACYCNALTLNTPEDFLVNIRQVFAEMLINKQMYNEAKTEIQQIIKTKERKGWNLSSKIKTWIEQPWYLTAEAKANNYDLYNIHKQIAEELLFQDIPEVLVAVEFVNKDKKMLNFIRDKENHGFFSYKDYRIKPQIGDVLKVRLEPKGNEGFYRVLTIKSVKEEEVEDCKAIKEVSGFIRINDGQSFGFLDDIFIAPDLIDKHNLKNQVEITCKAILSFHKKKEEWGWKCFEILTN